MDLKNSLRFKISSLPYGGVILTQIDRLISKIGDSVVIQGSYNAGNIGDMAIGIIIKEELKKFGIDSHLNGFINHPKGHIPNFKKYDYHIIGGGGVIRDYPKGYLETRLKPIGTAKKASAVLGVGFEGVKTEKGRKLLKKLDQCAFILVRDEESKKYLQPFIEKDIEVAACPTFLIKPSKASIIIKKPAIGINLRDIYDNDPKWGFYAYYPKTVDILNIRRQYINYLRKTLIHNLKSLSKDYNLYFIPFAKQDTKFANNYLRNISLTVLPLQPPSKTLATIQQMDKMICMRYHSIIFSIIAQKPFFAISYHNKTKNILEKIKNISFVDFLDFESYDIDFSISKSHLSKIKMELTISAQKNFDKLKQLFLGS